MEQYFFNGKNGLWYDLRYLRKHRRVLCTELLTSGKLNTYLADIDEQAEELFFCAGKGLKQAILTSKSVTFAALCCSVEIFTIL